MSAYPYRQYFYNLTPENQPDIYPGVYINGLVDCAHKVTIEKDVFCGHDVLILTGSHDPTKFGKERQMSSAGGPITIHEGVWIASRAMILGPAEIGKFAVIAAGSVVRGNVPDYALVAGNPAKVKKIYPHE